MGAGFHGGFGGTKGASENSAPVNSSKDVRYSKKKTEGYLLNPSHPKGGAKAKFMKDVLGYCETFPRSSVKKGRLPLCWLRRSFFSIESGSQYRCGNCYFVAQFL